jgi:hypothetical protein
MLMGEGVLLTTMGCWALAMKEMFNAIKVSRMNSGFRFILGI